MQRGIKMKNIKLNNSEVTFKESPHGYFKGDKEYSGITGLIHAVKRLGIYPNANEYVKKYIIPKAGEYGTCVHNAIEFYEATSIKNTTWEMKFDTHDVSEELETYLKLKAEKGCENIASEYNVEYGDYSSNIDNVWADGKDEIYLVDTKTNNLDYYPDGETGLKEYLTWQLNCYRVMFEKQNPHLKVKGLLANWIRKGDGRTWEIPFIEDKDVIELLNTKYDDVPFEEKRFKYYHIVDGKKVYYDEDVEIKSASKDALILPNNVIEKFCYVESQYTAFKAQFDKMKETLLRAMKENNVKSWDCSLFKASLVPASTSQSFDKDSFFKVHDELKGEIEKFTKTTNKKESIRLTFRSI